MPKIRHIKQSIHRLIPFVFFSFCIFYLFVSTDGVTLKFESIFFSLLHLDHWKENESIFSGGQYIGALYWQRDFQMKKKTKRIYRLLTVAVEHVCVCVSGTPHTTFINRHDAHRNVAKTALWLKCTMRELELFIRKWWWIPRSEFKLSVACHSWHRLEFGEISSRRCSTWNTL